MSRLTTTIVVLSLFGATTLGVPSLVAPARAQTGGTGTSKPSGPPPAPIGHRQPTKADVSPGATQDNNGLLGAAAADDKALDRKIKSICKGC